MKTITRHISSMLYDHECVIVPGLGAFITNSVDATIDVNRGLLLPPRKEVVFNIQLTHNDGLLTNCIAQSEKITYSEAAMRIKGFVDTLKSDLQSGEIVTLPHLGKMALLKNDAIAFTSDSKMNYLSESYGLGSISAPVLPIKTSYSIRIGAHPQARRVAGWAAAVALLLCFGPKLNDISVPERNNTNYASMASVFEAAMAPSTTMTEEKELYYNVAEAIAEEQIEEVRYHIIIGSFPTLKDAKRRRAELEKKGITDIELITTPNSKRVRLSVASFATQEEAKEQNRIIRKIQGMEKAWVLKE
ncbi:MAG: SPOR domain-containing protein [Bacteroidales bacterium]|nr:SPOR domain-containing protein [Bacteroidales bacterium]